MKNFEIELRFEILNSQELPTFTAALRPLGSKQVVDSYLDTQQADLIKKGVYVRIRDNKKVDIKFNRECLHNPDLELQPYCEEYTYLLPLQKHDLDSFNSIVKTIGLIPPSQASFDEFIQLNNLIHHRVVDKIRTSYVKDDFTIVIDEVAGLGSFLEIELLAHTIDAVESIKTRMSEMLSSLSLNPLKTGYDSLILRKNNFDQYLMGRFILDEDKPMREALLRQHAFQQREKAL
jgi:predicted adenylyl cyclase CyaB